MIHLGGEVTIITNANGEGSVELKSQLSKSSSDGISVKSSPKNGLIPISNADIYFSKEGEVKEVTIIFDRVVEQKIRLLLPTPGRNTFQVYSANYGNFRFDSDGFEEFYTPNHLISTNIQPIDTTVTVKRGKATSFYLSVSRIDPLPPNRIIKQLEYKFREARPDTTILVTY